MEVVNLTIDNLHIYDKLLNDYFKHPNTPYNNSSSKLIKLDLYDGISGILTIVIDKDQIVGTHGVLIDNDIAKFPHRLHIRKDYTHLSNKFIDEYFDPMCYDWLSQKQITGVYCSINQDNHLALFWSSLRHQRRNKNKINLVNSLGQTTRNQNWFIYDKLVYEMYCWQYIIFTSSNDNWLFPNKKTQPIDDQVINALDKRFDYIENLGWKI